MTFLFVAFKWEKKLDMVGHIIIFKILGINFCSNEKYLVGGKVRNGRYYKNIF